MQRLFKSSLSLILFFSLFNAMRMFTGANSVVYMLDKGFSLADVGYAKGMQAVIILLLDVPTAWLADRYSKRFFVVLSIFFSAGWLLCMAAATGRPMLYAAEVLNAISLAGASGVALAYLIDHAGCKDKEHINRLLSRYHQYSLLAMAIAGLTAPLLFAPSAPQLWLYSGVGMTILLACALVALPPAGSFHKDTAPTWHNVLQGIRKLADDRLTRSAALSLIHYAFFYQVFIQFWQPLASGFQPLPDHLGPLLGFLFSALLFAQYIAAWIAGKAGSIQRGLKVSHAIEISAIAVLLVSIYAGIAAFWLAILLLFGANRLRQIGLQSVIHEKISSGMRATLESTISTVLRVGLIVLMPLIGWLNNQFGIHFFAGYIVLTAVAGYAIARKLHAGQITPS